MEKQKDPVKHCEVYKKEGCAHVDGYLCEFNTCNIRLDDILRRALLRSAKVVHEGKFENRVGAPENKF